MLLSSALPWNFLVFDAEKWWRLHFTGAPHQREAAAAMPEYFSKLLMGFRLTTKADAACIVTLTQPEMKLHPSTTKLFQSIHGERTKIGDRKWSMTKVGATKKSLFVLLLNKPNVQSISRGTNHMICIIQLISSLVFPIPIINFKITWLLVSQTCWDVL